MVSAKDFNEDYYQNGITKRKSGYENHHYIPTRSYEEAIEFEEYIGGSVLDYGCAQGYLVHALRQIGEDAHGYDFSKYAIDNCKLEVKEYVHNKLPGGKFQTVICKDVMEHVPEDRVLDTLKQIKKLVAWNAIFIIPLGDNDKFRIREYEIDTTHVTKKDEDWWINKLREAGFRIESFHYKIGAIKKKWTEKYPYGNGFFEVLV